MQKVTLGRIDAMLKWNIKGLNIGKSCRRMHKILFRYVQKCYS